MNSIYELLNGWELETALSLALSERDMAAVREMQAVMRARRERVARMLERSAERRAQLDAFYAAAVERRAGYVWPPVVDRGEA